MSLNVTSPNFIRGPLNGPIPRPEPLDLDTTNSQKLLDELAVAAQFQVVIPVASIRKQWRDRMNEVRAELGKRTAPKGAL